MRLIDADALKDFYGNWSNDHTEFVKPEIDCYIDMQPTIDPESLAEYLRRLGYEVKKCQH